MNNDTESSSSSPLFGDHSNYGVKMESGLKCRCFFHHVYPTLSKSFACEVRVLGSGVSK